MRNHVIGNHVSWGLTVLYSLVVFLMEITHIESALEMGGYSAESGSISSLKNTNVSSISVPILHTHSLCLLWKKWSSIHEAIFKHYMVSIRHMMRSHILFSFRPYFHMLRNIGPNHLYVSIPNIRKILRQLCLKWSFPIY